MECSSCEGAVVVLTREHVRELCSRYVHYNGCNNTRTAHISALTPLQRARSLEEVRSAQGLKGGEQPAYDSCSFWPTANEKLMTYAVFVSSPVKATPTASVD